VVLSVDKLLGGSHIVCVLRQPAVGRSREKGANVRNMTSAPWLPILTHEDAQMATAPISPAPRARVEQVAAPLKTLWQKLGTPVLVVLLALGVVFTLTRNWNTWEGGRIEQATNDAYLRRDLTPLSTKVAGLVRAVKVADYQQVHKGDELVLLEDDDYQAQVNQAAGAVDAA
jgi:acetyl/propionyl-CoA carboxylase alpha subunit